MASVTSLDKDLRKMRLDKYTPQAANEVMAPYMNQHCYSKSGSNGPGRVLTH